MDRLSASLQVNPAAGWTLKAISITKVNGQVASTRCRIVL